MMLVSKPGGGCGAHAATVSGDVDGSKRMGLTGAEAHAWGAATNTSMAAAGAEHRPSGETLHWGGGDTRRGAGASSDGVMRDASVPQSSGCSKGIEAIRLASSASDEQVEAASLSALLSRDAFAGETEPPGGEDGSDEASDIAEGEAERRHLRGQICSKTGRRWAHCSQVQRGGATVRRMASFWGRVCSTGGQCMKRQRAP